MHQAKPIFAAIAATAALLLAACAGEKPVEAPVPVKAEDAKSLIERSLPQGVPDRAGWTSDMYAAFTVLTITPSRENVCAVVAVIEQESGQQMVARVPCRRPSGPLFRELLLDRIEQCPIHNRWLLAGEDFVLVLDLTNVEAIAQQMGEVRV